MVNTPLDAVLHHVRATAGTGHTKERTDADLLHAFSAHRDQGAFTALVKRHGAMVLGVCRHVLKHAEDAEDAFQATFLVLAQNAAAIRKREVLASWLHGTAYRAAMNAKRAATRRRVHEGRARAMRSESSSADVSWREVQAILDEEILRLGEKYRAVFILCCVEGRSRAEAARELDVKEGTVSSRLAGAKKQLQERLARRGIVLSAVLAAAALASSRGRTAVPALLGEATVRAALACAAGGTTASGVVSPRIAALVGGVTRALFATRLKIATALLLAAAAVVAGAGFAIYQAPATQESEVMQEGERKAGTNAPERPKIEDQAQAATDRFGDPLPHGAVARLGTVRFRPGTSIDCVTFAPDGKVLACGGVDGMVSLWDADTGKNLRRLGGRLDAFGDRGWVSSLAFSPDGKTLAVGHGNAEGPNLLSLWDVGTGKELRGIEAHGRQNVNSVAFSPDGKTLASGGDDRTIASWDATTGNLFWRSENQGAVAAVAFRPDGKTIVSGGEGGVIHIWDTSTGTELSQMKGSEDKVTVVAVSPDGKVLASGGNDPTLRLWDIATGKELRNMETPCERGLAFAPDGRTLASSGHDCVIRLWDVATGKEIRRTADQPTHSAIAFSPDGKTLASGGLNDFSVRIWDAATARELRPFGGQRGGAVSQLVFSPDGKILASGCGDGDRAVYLWDVATGAELRQFPLRGSDYYLSLAFSPNGALLAMMVKGEIQVWEVSTGKMLFQWKDPEGHMACYGFSPDGRMLACGLGFHKGDNQRGTVILLDVASGKVLDRLEGHPSWVDGLAFSPDGKTLASRSWEGTKYVHPRMVFLWDVATGKELRRIRGVAGGEGGAGVGFLAFLDLHRLTSAGLDWPASPRGALFQVWDVDMGKELRPLGLRPEVPLVSAISPNRKALLGADRDDAFALWELASGQQRLRFSGHRGQVDALAFSPDRRTVASGSRDTSILLWDVDRMARGDRAGNLPPATVARLWADLGSEDAARGFGAVRTLTGAPGQAVDLIKEHLKPVAAPNPARLAQLIAALDENDFALRKKATAELEGLGELAEGALRRLVETGPSAEARRRAEGLLEKLAGGPASGKLLRSLRALEVLEDIATPPAQQVLQTLAEGFPEARVTWEAKASLSRLQRKTVADR
jgi:RNA polymerase sigma factor (sigma-70 family)